MLVTQELPVQGLPVQGIQDQCAEQFVEVPVPPQPSALFPQWPVLHISSSSSYNDAIIAVFPQTMMEEIAWLLRPPGILEAAVCPRRGWHKYRSAQSCSTDRRVGPDFDAIESRAERAAAMGHQRGSFASKVSLPAVVEVGLGKEANMEAACRARHPCAIHADLDHDLGYAVSVSVLFGNLLRTHCN